MDLIEILLRQDIDLGVTRDLFDGQLQQQQRKDGQVEGDGDTDLADVTKDDCGLHPGSFDSDAQLSEDPFGSLVLLSKDAKNEDENAPCDPWSGLNYTIDSETGEHVVVEPASVAASTAEPHESANDVVCDVDDDDDSALIGSSLHTSELLTLPDELDTIPLEELHLALPEPDKIKTERETVDDEREDSLSLFDRQNSFSDQLRELEEMIQTAQLHQLPHGGRPFQGRMPYLRPVSMEQRWQDLTNLLSIPPASEADLHGLHHHQHHHHNMGHMGMLHHSGGGVGGSSVGPLPPHLHNHHLHHQQNYSLPGAGGGYASLDNRTAVLLQNATLPPPAGDVNNSMSYPGGDPSIIGAAVVTSMSALSNGNDSLGVDGSSVHGHHGHYQMDAGSLLYPSNHSDVNQTADGFLNAILNDEDLQLMDMAMNEGMYTMRMLENEDAMDTSSDSAVSSMASSERVPSVSYGEWMEPGTSESPHHSHNQQADEQDRTYYGAGQGVDCTQQQVGGGANKYRPYNYSYAPGMTPVHRPGGPGGPVGGADGGVMDSRRLPPVAQKKYQLFGKRLPSAEPATSGSQYGSLPRGSASMPQPTAPLKYQDYVYPSPVASGTLHDPSSSTSPVTTNATTSSNSSSSYGSLEGATAPNASSSLASIEQKYSCRVEFSRQHPADEQLLLHHHNHHQGAPPLEHVQHNHTYHVSAENAGDPSRPAAARDKHRRKGGANGSVASGSGSVDEHVSRDERRARSMKLPMTSEEIINLPMDEFNERLSKYDLSEAQLALIRDIRRRGKNKVAAQNCRKRKLDQIMLLAEEVTGMQKERHVLLEEQQIVLSERQRLKDKYAHLYRHVFQSLRDPDGSPYSPFEYSLQQAADGNILLVPRNGTNNMELDPCKGAKSKRKDDDK